MKGTHLTHFYSNFRMFLKTRRRLAEEGPPFRGMAASLTDWAHLNNCPHNSPRLKQPHERTWQSKHAISYSCHYLPLGDNHRTTGCARPPAHNSINIYPYNTSGYGYIFKKTRFSVKPHVHIQSHVYTWLSPNASHGERTFILGIGHLLSSCSMKEQTQNTAPVRALG